MRSTTQLRQDICTAARAEFARHGLAGARIDRIADAARASKERLYAHFGDKESLFKEVLAVDSRDYFATAIIAPDAVAEFAGAVYDAALRHPDHLRMISWARLEGLTLSEPTDAEEQPITARSIAAIEAAQDSGHVDPTWDPHQVLVLLFGIGLAWAQYPGADADAVHPDVVAVHRACAVEAAARVIASPG